MLATRCSLPPVGIAIADRPPLARLARAVAATFALEPAVLFGPTRGSATAARARHVFAYVVHVGLGLTFAEIGREIGRRPSAIGHAVRAIEDARDEDPALDAALDAYVALAAPSRVRP